MSLTRSNELQRLLTEATRQAAVATGSAVAAAGPQAPGGLNTGMLVADTWTPFGRVGITAISDGFLPREV